MMTGTFRQKLRNNAAAISVCVITAMSATAVVLANRCGDRAACGKAPMSEPIRNDGICDQRESYPYMRNKDGTVMKKNGKPVQNPYYSKADCHRGDNVCDNVASVSELKDPAGNPVEVKTLLTQGASTIRLKDGRTFALPLENETSYDCQMEKVRQNPCSDSPGASLIDRPLLDKPDTETPIVQRPQAFIELMFKTPSANGVKMGNNYFVVMPNLYKESCGAGLPACDPNVPIECFCPNHKSCVPSTCGNGKLDKGEDCDPKHPSKAYRVKLGHLCSIVCKWVKKPPKPPTPMEVDPPVMKPDPKPVCGDNKVNQASEECDGTDKSACGNRGCTSSCKCEKPPATTLSRCQGDPSVTAVVNTVKRYTNGKAINFRQLYNHTAASKVYVDVRLIMGGQGEGQSYTVTSSCTGSTCGRNSLSSSENQASFGSFNVGLLKITPQGASCFITVKNPITATGG